ncbi:MAG: sugar kinase [Caldiserica bacterium]|jgi:sugar/nucleoside kinase (ribokinase family)|nr:sugar kinase [Caldisericota bacterium]MDH7563206.1 sugar kinase [Caldisericota bacterium]
MILVIGDINIDISGRFDSWPEKGGCVFSSKPQINLGGTGANVGVALSRLELKVSLASAVGNDAFGREALENLKREKINTALVQVQPQYNTGLVFTAIDEFGERTFFVFRRDCADIHMTLEPEALLKEQADEIFVTGVSIAEGIESYHSILGFLEKSGKQKIFFDPNIRSPNGKITEETRERYLHVLRFSKVFLPNEQEILEIMRENSLKTAIKKALEMGVEEIWVKRGKEDFLWASQKGGFVAFPTMKVSQVSDTTGAGDLFDAAIIFGLTNNWTAQETAIFAAKATAFSVQRPGSISSFPSLHDLNF